MSVFPFVWHSLTPTGRLFVEFYTGQFKKKVAKIQFWLILNKNIRLFVQTPSKFLGALVRIAKSLISFLMFFCVSVCFSVCDSHWTDFCDTLCWRILIEICWESQSWLELTKQHTSWRLKYIFFFHSAISPIDESILRLPWASHLLISQTKFLHAFWRLCYSYISCLVCFVEYFHGLMACLCYVSWLLIENVFFRILTNCCTDYVS
jgi:hypothetical protein